MATGLDPMTMSYRKFMFALGNAKMVKAWLEGRGDLPEIEKAPAPDMKALGL